MGLERGKEIDGRVVADVREELSCEDWRKEELRGLGRDGEGQRWNEEGYLYLNYG